MLCVTVSGIDIMKAAWSEETILYLRIILDVHCKNY